MSVRGEATAVFGFGQGAIELPYEATAVGSWTCAECHDEHAAVLAILAAAFTEVGAAPSASAVARRGLRLLEADTTAAAAQLRQRLQGYAPAPRSP